MKITFEVPEGTVAAILNLVFGNSAGMALKSISAGSDEIYDGAVIDHSEEAQP